MKGILRLYKSGIKVETYNVFGHSGSDWAWQDSWLYEWPARSILSVEVLPGVVKSSNRGAWLQFINDKEGQTFRRRIFSQIRFVTGFAVHRVKYQAGWLCEDSWPARLAANKG